MSNRAYYFNYIEEKFNIHAYRVKQRGKLNVLDLNEHSENFYMHFLNNIFGWNLINLNEIKHNVEAIDLIDETEKIIVQVSATATKQKLDSSLSKEIYINYPGFNFKFISIAREFSIENYEIPMQACDIVFDSQQDIIDNSKLLKKIIALNIYKLKELYKLMKEEFGNEIDIAKMDSNLATIINILSTENLNEIDPKYEINAFEIQKKIEYNNLSEIKDIIDDYKIYHHKLEEKYNLFDQNGINKSYTILQTIRKEYCLLCKTISDQCEIFLEVMNKIINIVVNSKNYLEIPYEELEFCVGIITVDAFIRCKIFKNPEGYSYVAT